MTKNKLAKVTFGIAFLIVMIVPAMAFAQSGETSGKTYEASVYIAKYAASAAAICVAAMSGAYAQSKIGSAAAGTLAERPEVAMNMVIMMVLPEIIVLLGFVIAFMINASIT